MNRNDAKGSIETRFQSLLDNTPHFHNATLLVAAPDSDVQWKFAGGHIDGEPVHSDQPYHAASVAKTFTATLTAMLHVGNELDFDDPIARYLPEDILDGLHVFRGTDYTEDVQIHHLLSNTSGLPHLLSDEFGMINRRKEQSTDGRTFFDLMKEDPNRFWEPEETIEWAKAHLHPHFPPGDGIFYSEVGFNLLGLIVEEVTGVAYQDALSEHLFKPLSMDHSYLSQFSEPAVESDLPVSPLYDGDERFDVEKYRSFSGWFAGGQTVNTTEDLFAFHRALVEGALVSEAALEKMTDWRRLSIGLDYGYGVLRFRPFPLATRYRMWGGLGSTNSFMLYNPGHNAYVIGSFNQTAERGKAFRIIFRVLRTISKLTPTE